MLLNVIKGLYTSKTIKGKYKRQAWYRQWSQDHGRGLMGGCHNAYRQWCKSVAQAMMLGPIEIGEYSDCRMIIETNA